MRTAETTGNPAVFAIEHRLVRPCIRGGLQAYGYGHVRLWLGGRWLGDFGEAMYLGTMAESLDRLRTSDTSESMTKFDTAASVPSFAEMSNRGDWSWGEAFDDFQYVYYAVVDEDRIHFAWELFETQRGRYPDFPAGRHHASVSRDEFAAVLDAFFRSIDAI